MRSSVLFHSPLALLDPFVENEDFSASSSSVEETKSHYLIQVDIPGVSKEDIKISLDGRHLLVEAERKMRREGKVRKVFSLPEDVNFDQIEAQLQNGVLEIAVPKAERYKPKAITISDGKESFWTKLDYKTNP